MSTEETAEITRMDRVYLRVLLGTLRAIEAQLRVMSPPLRATAELPSPELVATWVGRAKAVLAAAVDADETPVVADDVGTAA